MSSRSLFLVLLASCCYVHAGGDPISALFQQLEQVFSKFLDLAEQNRMNVSVVTSKAKLWSNGQLQVLKDNALLMPPNDVLLTESKLSTQIGEQWLKDTDAGGKGINIHATYRVISSQDGVLKEREVKSSKAKAAPPMSPSLEAILYSLQTNKGLIQELQDYEIMYNYLVATSGGQNKSVNVLAVKLNVTVVDSHHVSAKDVNKMKEILAKVWVMLADLDLVVDVLSEAINEEVPLKHSTWQVLIGPESFHIPSGSKWVRIDVSDFSVIVFALAQ